MNKLLSTFKTVIARRRFSIVLLLGFLAVYVFYTYAGRALIADIYEGRSITLLAGVIDGRGSVPLEVYFRKADAILVSLAVFIALVILFSRVKGVGRYYLYFISYAFALLLFREASGEDLYHHLSRLADICAHLRMGDWYLFLSRNAAGGKGLPIYVYYSSWLGIIPYFINSTGLSLFATMKLTMLFLLALSGLGMYLALKLFVSRDWAILGALLYVSSNFVSGNVFPRSNLGSAYGACLMPFVFYALARWLKFSRMRDAILVALTGALLLIVHPLVFINALLGFVLFAVIYAVWNTREKRQWSSRLFQTLFIGLLLIVNSAVFLIPSLWERRYVYLHHHGLLRFRPETFLTLKGYLQFLDYRNPGFLVTAGIIVSVWFTLSRRGTRREGINSVPIAASLAVVAMYVFLTLKISIVIWERIDVLQGNQFPWRMILPLTFFGVICTVMVLENLFSRTTASRSKKWTIWLFRLTVFQGMVFLSPFFNQISGESQSGIIDSKLSAYWMKENGWGLDEYLPNTVNLPAVKDAIIIGDVKVLKREYLNRNEEFRITPVEQEGIYTLPKYWHTRYQVYVDGKEVEQKSDTNGKIAVYLLRGADSLVIRYAKPGYVFWPEKLSLLSMVVSILVLGYFSLSERRNSNKIRSPNDETRNRLEPEP